MSGYFDDNDIKLTIPVVNVEIVCCLPYHNSMQNFTINFENDQPNDKLTIYMGENALKGKYKLTLKNGAGRSQLVQYSIYSIDSDEEVSEIDFYLQGLKL